MARSDVTTTRTTPPTITRSAGSTRPPGAPRTTPAGRGTGAWVWIIGLIIALAVIWFLWSWWDGREIDAEPEIGAAGSEAVVTTVDQRALDDQIVRGLRAVA